MCAADAGYFRLVLVYLYFPFFVFSVLPSLKIRGSAKFPIQQKIFMLSQSAWPPASSLRFSRIHTHTRTHTSDYDRLGWVLVVLSLSSCVCRLRRQGCVQGHHEADDV